MLLDTSREGVKKAFEYLVRLPFTKPLLHRINEAARGKCIAYFSLHRILENTPDLCSHPHRIAKTALTLDEARKILEQIKKTLYFVSLKESLDYLLGHISLERSVAVLFIEAPYVQTLKNLVPLARELEIPLTVAVSTNSLLTGEPLWMDEISYRVINTPKEELAINFIDRSFTLTNSQERFAAAQHIINNLSNCSAPTLRSRLNHLRETLHETAILPTSERIATTAQLLKFSHDDVTYIIAGNEHLPFLALLDEERADRELSVAKLELQAMLGDVLLPVYFYPLGVDKRHQPDITKLLINSSFTAAISRNVGVCRPGDNMFRLVRLPLGLDGKSFEQFELQGLADAIDEFLLVTLAHNEGL
jgi:hypothetical protein